jgi:transposase-like protein
MNLLKVAQTFATEDLALEYWIKTRWPDGVRCLACDNAKVWGISTKGKTGKPCFLFECAECGLHFSATTGTMFHDSHLPLTKCFAAIALMCEAKKGVSANQVARHIGCSYKTAWHLCHRIRNAMNEGDAPKIGGPGKIVEIDETFVGGKKRRQGVKAGKDAKIKVIGMAERGGRIHLQIIESTKALAIGPVLEAKLDPDTEKVVTDAHATYSSTIPRDKHEEHSHKDELRDEGFISSTRHLESAFSLFKRGIAGSFHMISAKHLHRYLSEFEYRFNERKDPFRFENTVCNMTETKAMPYAELIGKE